MRSTLTLEPDVAHQVQELVAATRKPYKTVVNELLRQGLAHKPSQRQPFVQTTLELGWNDTLDPTGFNRLADALAVEADDMVLKRFEDAS
jgi:formate dehydrogenase maturation protein FdhE